MEVADLAALGVTGSRRADLAEDGLQRLLTSWGIPAHLKPQLPLYGTSGRRIEPDLGLRLGLTALSTMVSLGQDVDTTVELKIQDRAGSTDEKLPAAIRAAAHTWDRYGVASIIVHALCPRVVGHGYLEDLQRNARSNLVGFIAIEDLTAETLRSTVADLVERRTEMALHKSVEALMMLHSPEVLAAAARRAEEHVGITASA